MAMTQSAETWAITSQAKNKLAAAPTKMERSMLNFIYRDKKTNLWVRETTKVRNVIEQVRRRKWTWAEHISRIRDNRWTLYCVSPPGNPTMGKDLQENRQKGGDDLADYWKGTFGQRIAQDRHMWKQHAEAFAQPRDTMDAYNIDSIWYTAL